MCVNVLLQKAVRTEGIAFAQVCVRDLLVHLSLEVNVFGHFDPSRLWRLSAPGIVTYEC